MAYNSKFTGAQIDALLDASEAMKTSKEDVANKVTSIGADANDTTFPTTRAALNSIAEVKNIEVTPEMLSESTKQYINASGGGTITNLADDEDLTSVGNVLKLANKDYSPTSYSGMGRVYLRKNMVDGKNILTQGMMTKENTIYIIQYDYDLNGATINVPANCTLDFQGGSLGNGTVTFADTFIKGEPHIYTELGGSISNGKIDVTWFGIDNNGLTDASVRLQSLINLWYSKVIYFPTGKYLISNQILLRKGCYFSGDGDSSVLKLMYEGFNFEISSSQSNYAVVIEIKDLSIVGTGPSWYDSDAESKKTECSFLEIKYPTAYTYRTNFSNITISNVKECIKIDKCYWARFINVAMYSYDIALDLGDCSSTAIIGCTFRGGFDKGLYLHNLSGSTNAGIGVSINGCDFSGNNYCGLYIIGNLKSSSITGNYFESEPGRQIVIGEEGTTTSGMHGCLVYGNSGLWDKSGIRGININGSFTNNLLNASTNIVTKGTCRRNIGLDENNGSVGIYSEVFVYGNKYSNGYIDSFRDQIFSEQIRDVCIPANGSVTLYDFTARYFELLFFNSSDYSITLKIRTIETEPIYLVGTADGGVRRYEDAKGFFTNSLGIIDLGTFKNCHITLENTSSDNVRTDIELKFFKNIYGK